MKTCLVLIFFSIFCYSKAQSPDERELIERLLRTNPSLEQLNSIRDVLQRNNLYEYFPLVRPIKERIRVSSDYGYRLHPITKKRKFHAGVDIASNVGTSVHASASGNVIFSGIRRGYGRCVIIRHIYGYETVYAHLVAYYTKKGSYVRQGDVIGFVGNTGQSTGNHLHYEVRFKGVPVKPLIVN